MADRIELRVGLLENPAFMRMRTSLALRSEDMFLLLYRTASWFAEQGKQGKLRTRPEVLDLFLDAPGCAAALMSEGWLRQHGEVLTLHHFCTVSAARKGLGAAVRAEVLSCGRCVACGSTEDLVVDHILPIALGGSCERSNLQCLCALCNRSKGRKHPSVWRGR